MASDETTASVEQVASVVAEHEPDLRDVIGQIGDGCWTAFGSNPECQEPADKLPVQALVFTAETFALVLGAIDEDRPENDHYIGEIPEEVEELHADTLRLTEEVVSVVDEFIEEGCTTQDCPERGLQTRRSVESLEDKLDAWSPYGVG